MDDLLVAIEVYRTDHISAEVPISLAYLLTDVGAVGCTSDTALSKIKGWCGPYIDPYIQENPNEHITDGWSTAFFYSQITPTTGLLRSWGPNKTDDAGAVDDITRNF